MSDNAASQGVTDSQSALIRDKLLQLETYVATEFSITISHRKMLQDAEYSALVVAELSALDDPTLNTVLNEFLVLRNARASGPATHQELPVKAPLFANMSAGMLLGAALIMGFLLASVAYLVLERQQNTAASIPVPAAVAAPATPVEHSPTSVVVAPVLPVSQPKLAFRMHGSNTIGEKLAPALLEAYLRQQGVEKMAWVQGDKEVERQLQYLQDGQVYAIELHAHGSSTAFKDLAASQADLGMASRRIKSKEVETLKSTLGDMSKVGNEHIVGLDGLAVIINQNNDISRITTETLAAVFAGEITNWSQIGGADLPIRVFARDQNSGTWDTFKNLVLKKYDKKLLESATRLESSSELSERVAADDGAIGFIGLNYIGYAKALAIADADDTAAIFPTRFTVGTEDYALARRLYLYTPTSASQAIKDFVHYAISTEGQHVVDEVGLISQNLREETVYPVEGAPNKFNEYARSAKRLSLNFRFNNGDKDLDNKGKRDLERLIEFLEQEPGRRIVLMGYADSIGEADRNLWLSKRRARVVEGELVSRGIPVMEVLAMGEALPVANNNNEAGRERNRRVEVWVM